MFGYLRICRDELKIREYNQYKAVYCTLCRALSRRYGFPSRMILGYDYTFLALLGMSLSDSSMTLKKGRCGMNCLKKCSYCTEAEGLFDFVADVSIIMFYYKLRDTLSDEGFLKRFSARLVYPAAALMRKRACSFQPETDTRCADMIKNQMTSEKKDICSVDEAAHETALTVSFIASELSHNGAEKEILSSFGYQLGRWIYLVDALDDIEKDSKFRRFNPFLKKLEQSGGRITDTNSAKELRCYANEVINTSAAFALSDFRRLNLRSGAEILENIMTLGISSVQKSVYEKEEKQR